MTEEQTRLPKVALMVVLTLGALGWLYADSGLKTEQKRNVGKTPLERHTIAVSADHKVVAVPDIATLSIGLTALGQKASEVQNESNRKFAEIVKQVKAKGVSDKDVKTTQYYLNPEYEWGNNGRRFLGYRIRQTIEVKIRDFSKIGEIVELAGNLGANEIGNVNFTLDDRDKFVKEAREIAVKEAKEKAELMAREAGFKLGKLVGFSDGANNSYYYPYYSDARYGAEATKSMAPAPAAIEPGSQEVSSSVTLTYEIE